MGGNLSRLDFQTAQARIPPSEGVRTELWKYIRYLDQTPVVEELYDLQADAAEKRNLAGESDQAGILGQLRGRWEWWRQELR